MFLAYPLQNLHSKPRSLSWSIFPEVKIGPPDVIVNFNYDIFVIRLISHAMLSFTHVPRTFCKRHFYIVITT